MVATTSRSLLEIREVPEKTGREFERCLHIGAMFAHWCRESRSFSGRTRDETQEGRNNPTIPTVEDVGVGNGEVTEK